MENQVPPEQITLPHSEGIVRFRDIEDLDGIQFNIIRDAALMARRFMLPVSQLLTMAAQQLITSWNIPGRPNYPTPGSPDGMTMDSLNHLHWRDVKFIGENLFNAIEVLVADTNPTVPPTSESSSSSGAAS